MDEAVQQRRDWPSSVVRILRSDQTVTTVSVTHCRCDDKDQIQKQVLPSNPSREKTRTGLYELADENFLLTPEQQLLKKMDEDYENVVSLLQMQHVIPSERDLHEPLKAKDRNKVHPKLQSQLEAYHQIKAAIVDSNQKVRKSKSVKKNDSRNPKTISLKLSKTIPEDPLREQSFPQRSNWQHIEKVVQVDEPQV